MPKRENHLLVQDLIDSFSKILNYTKGLDYEEFIKNDMAIDAVVRNFEVIGEAANLLTEEFKSNNPQVEWRKLKDFRNKLIHEYFGIDYNIVWDIVEDEVQKQLEFLKTIDLSD